MVRCRAMPGNAGTPVHDRAETGLALMVIDTPRTRLRCWQEADQETFAAMNGHPDVMLDLYVVAFETASVVGLLRIEMASSWAMRASCPRTKTIRSVSISRSAGGSCGTPGAGGMPRRPPVRRSMTPSRVWD